MGSVKYNIGKAGLALASLALRLAAYVCICVLIFWVGKQAYSFGYQVFNQKAISPGEGVEVTISIPSGATDMEIAEILELRGLVKDRYVFIVQEYLLGYHGLLHGGTYTLSTAYEPHLIMSILAGEEEAQENEG